MSNENEVTQMPVGAYGTVTIDGKEVAMAKPRTEAMKEAIEIHNDRVCEGDLAINNTVCTMKTGRLDLSNSSTWKYEKLKQDFLALNAYKPTEEQYIFYCKGVEDARDVAAGLK